MLISISSTRWVWVWVGIEINILSFIPLIRSIKDNYVFRVVECAVKYFIVQAMGSGFFLLRYLLIITSINNIFYIIYRVIIILRFLIKLGAAPFHVWFPVVIKGLCWFSCGILIILQKLIPLVIISCLINGACPSYILFFCVLGSIIGGLGGLNQINLRYLLAYSSIGHLGWILIGCLTSINILIIYYLVYIIISRSIILFIINLDINFIIIERIFIKNFIIYILFLFLLFSLGGIPPFLGFISKWLIIEVLVVNKFFIIGGFILLGSLLSIYYYLKILLNIILSRFNLTNSVNYVKYYNSYYYILSWVIFIRRISLRFLCIFSM